MTSNIRQSEKYHPLSHSTMKKSYILDQMNDHGSKFKARCLVISSVALHIFETIYHIINVALKPFSCFSLILVELIPTKGKNLAAKLDPHKDHTLEAIGMHMYKALVCATNILIVPVAGVLSMLGILKLESILWLYNPELAKQIPFDHKLDLLEKIQLGIAEEISTLKNANFDLYSIEKLESYQHRLNAYIETLVQSDCLAESYQESNLSNDPSFKKRLNTIQDSLNANMVELPNLKQKLDSLVMQRKCEILGRSFQPKYLILENKIKTLSDDTYAGNKTIIEFKNEIDILRTTFAKLDADLKKLHAQIQENNEFAESKNILEAYANAQQKIKRFSPDHLQCKLDIKETKQNIHHLGMTTNRAAQQMNSIKARVEKIETESLMPMEERNKVRALNLSSIALIETNRELIEKTEKMLFNLEGFYAPTQSEITRLKAAQEQQKQLQSKLHLEVLPMLAEKFMTQDASVLRKEVDLFEKNYNALEKDLRALPSDESVSAERFRKLSQRINILTTALYNINETREFLDDQMSKDMLKNQPILKQAITEIDDLLPQLHMGVLANILNEKSFQQNILTIRETYRNLELDYTQIRQDITTPPLAHLNAKDIEAIKLRINAWQAAKVEYSQHVEFVSDLCQHDENRIKQYEESCNNAIRFLSADDLKHRLSITVVPRFLHDANLIVPQNANLKELTDRLNISRATPQAAIILLVQQIEHIDTEELARIGQISKSVQDLIDDDHPAKAQANLIENRLITLCDDPASPDRKYSFKDQFTRKLESIFNKGEMEGFYEDNDSVGWITHFINTGRTFAMIQIDDVMEIVHRGHHLRNFQDVYDYFATRGLDSIEAFKQNNIYSREMLREFLAAHQDPVQAL